MITILLSLAGAAQTLDPEIRYTPGKGAYSICGVTAASPVALVETVMALPGAELLEQKGQYLTLVQDSERRFWTLAMNDHPAAPAIICRTIVDRPGGGSELKMEISCFADKASCDQLAQDFVAHNRAVLQGAQ